MFNRLWHFLRPQTSVAPTPAAQQTTAPHPAPIDVTEADFDAQILQSDQLAVVDCWADWCEPCGPMAAYMNFLASDFAGRIVVAALDVEENPTISERFAIMGLPTLLFFQAGVEVDRQVGLLPYEELRHRVEAHLSQGIDTYKP